MADQSKAIAAGITVLGGVLLWSAINNKHALSTAQSLVKGTEPTPGPAEPGLTPSVIQAGGGNTGLPYGTVGVSPPGPGENAWFTTMLATIGALPTSANLASMRNWSAREAPWNASPPDGALYTHNPLNTTLATSGDVGNVNSIGVKIYGSAAEGIAATAATLMGGYPAIVSALRRGSGLATGDPNVSAELSKWSGGGYSSV